jgi:hypothetical protein
MSAFGICRPGFGAPLTKSNSAAAAVRKSPPSRSLPPDEGWRGVGQWFGSDWEGSGSCVTDMKLFALGMARMSPLSNVPSRSFWSTARFDTPCVEASSMRSSPSRSRRRNSHQYFPPCVESSLRATQKMTQPQ